MSPVAISVFGVHTYTENLWPHLASCRVIIRVQARYKRRQTHVLGIISHTRARLNKNECVRIPWSIWNTYGLSHAHRHVNGL